MAASGRSTGSPWGRSSRSRRRASRKSRVRKQILALLEAQPFDDDLLEQWATDRRSELQRSGHYRADGLGDGRRDRSGHRQARRSSRARSTRSRRSTIAGDASVPEETLRDLMVTRPKGLPVVATGHLDRPGPGRRRLDDPGLLPDARLDRRARRPRRSRTARSPDSSTFAIDVVEGPRAFVAERQGRGRRAPDAGGPRVAPDREGGRPLQSRRRAPRRRRADEPLPEHRAGPRRRCRTATPSRRTGRKSTSSTGSKRASGPSSGARSSAATR